MSTVTFCRRGAKVCLLGHVCPYLIIIRIAQLKLFFILRLDTSQNKSVTLIQLKQKRVKVATTVNLVNTWHLLFNEEKFNS